jgi:hypothetical protein
MLYRSAVSWSQYEPIFRNMVSTILLCRSSLVSLSQPRDQKVPHPPRLNLDLSRKE